jgi:peroxiredoxin
MRMRTTLLWMTLALLAGAGTLIGVSVWQHRGPSARMTSLLQSTRLGSAALQAWLRAAAPAPTSGERVLGRGDRVPDIALPGLDGHPQSLSQWRGKRVLLNFWATWCTPCRREMPDLVAAQKRYGPHGVQIIGIAMDQPVAVRTYLKRAPVNYPVLIGLDAPTDLSPLFGNTLGALPFSVLIDRDGRIKATYYGALQPVQLRWWLAD